MYNWIFMPWESCTLSQHPDPVVFIVLTTVSSKQITLHGKPNLKRALVELFIVCQLSAWSNFRISCNRSLILCPVKHPLSKNPSKEFSSETLRNVSKAMDSSTSKQGQLLTIFLCDLEGLPEVIYPSPLLQEELFLCHNLWGTEQKNILDTLHLGYENSRAPCGNTILQVDVFPRILPPTQVKKY